MFGSYAGLAPRAYYNTLDWIRTLGVISHPGKKYCYFTQLPAAVEYDTTDDNAISIIYNTKGRLGTHITPVITTQTDLF